MAGDVYSWRQEPAREGLGAIGYAKHCLYTSTEASSPPRSAPDRLFCGAEFRSGKAPILIATDVASRGLGTSCELACKRTAASHTRDTRAFDEQGDDTQRSLPDEHVYSQWIHVLQTLTDLPFSKEPMMLLG